MFKIVENSYGDLGLRFDTYEQAADYLLADEDYTEGDMSLWIEEADE